MLRGVEMMKGVAWVCVRGVRSDGPIVKARCEPAVGERRDCRAEGPRGASRAQALARACGGCLLSVSP